jgi:3-dehydroquinate dehydratase II
VTGGGADPSVSARARNVHRREEFRHRSYVSAVPTEVIVGLGIDGHELALRWLGSAVPTGSVSG